MWILDHNVQFQFLHQQLLQVTETFITNIKLINGLKIIIFQGHNFHSGSERVYLGICRVRDILDPRALVNEDGDADSRISPGWGPGFGLYCLSGGG